MKIYLYKQNGNFVKERNTSDYFVISPLVAEILMLESVIGCTHGWKHGTDGHRLQLLSYKLTW